MPNTSLQYLRNNFSGKASDRLLMILLLVDVIFIVGHILVVFGDVGLGRNFTLDYDGGYPEFFQYTKFLFISLLIAHLVFGLKSYSYLPWLALFFVLGLDDAFGIHERFGWQFAHRLNMGPAMGLTAMDFGELVYSGIAGILFLSVLSRFYLRGSERFKKTSWDISILFAILVFFGVFVDILHAFFQSSPSLGAIFAVIEDGGEMIALSLLLWYFYFLVRYFYKERTFLYYFFTSRRKMAP